MLQMGAQLPVLPGEGRWIREKEMHPCQKCINLYDWAQTVVLPREGSCSGTCVGPRASGLFARRDETPEQGFWSADAAAIPYAIQLAGRAGEPSKRPLYRHERRSGNEMICPFAPVV